jgi:hypothetical protein
MGKKAVCNGVCGNSRNSVRTHIETIAYNEVGLKSAMGVEDMGTDTALELLEFYTVNEVLTKLKNSPVTGKVGPDVYGESVK